MTMLTMSPLMVGLVQAAVALPVFLVILPAGALADMVDRRRFLLITQGWMVLASGALGVLTLLHVVTPWMLLGFTFLLGLGAVMNDPAWQAITPELVPPEQHAAAVAMNSAGFNVARAIGPALGGMVIAAAGSGTAFLLNALSFFGVIVVLYRWKRPPPERIETGRTIGRCERWDPLCAAIAAGQVGTDSHRRVQRRRHCSIGLAPDPGAAFWGYWLWSFARCFGVGALAGATILPRLRRRLSVDGFVATAIVVFALMTFLAGRVQALASFAW